MEQKTIIYERFEELRLCCTCLGTYPNGLCNSCYNKDNYTEKYEPEYLNEEVKES